jgi:hypothetical protein
MMLIHGRLAKPPSLGRFERPLFVVSIPTGRRVRMVKVGSWPFRAAQADRGNESATRVVSSVNPSDGSLCGDPSLDQYRSAASEEAHFGAWPKSRSRRSDWVKVKRKGAVPAERFERGLRFTWAKGRRVSLLWFSSPLLAWPQTETLARARAAEEIPATLRWD